MVEICKYKAKKERVDIMLWKDRYNLGVELIDRQHQELFKRVSDFLEVLRSSNKWEEKVYKVNETLNFMKDYVVTHFHDEEAYQIQIGYPNFDSHKRVHLPSNMRRKAMTRS